MGSQANTDIMLLESCYEIQSLTGQQQARQIACDTEIPGAMNALMRFLCSHVSLLFRAPILFSESWNTIVSYQTLITCPWIPELLQCHWRCPQL